MRFARIQMLSSRLISAAVGVSTLGAESVLGVKAAITATVISGSLASTQVLLGSHRLRDPHLQRPQLLGVFVAGLVVGGNGLGDGRERNACGGRISISGGLGQLTGCGSVVQAHKATVDRASSIGLNGHIDGNLLDDGFALLADDADAVDVLGDDLDGGLRLPLAGGGGLQGLLLNGGIPLRLKVTRALNPAEADQGHGERRHSQ